MEKNTLRLRTLGAIAGAMVSLATPLMAWAAAGGTISFSGAIVAPQLRMTTGVTSAGLPVATAGAQARRMEPALTLTFDAPPGVAAGADVSLQVNDGVPPRNLVAARFVDNGGRPATARNGHYQVGRNGGVLSVSPARADTPDTRVTVVVSYE
ncbi:hypothetical protein [Paraburkholderia ginsengisoli]|uniref:Fimbrial protein n=1 Tax=Paraburkholderia ginsengisoli TaxID=311231 RepID=A0A7T4N2T7_9BURK|nr:hypothetical protein [Paraburkholderia ginsengisoli]QQC64154.1 hypothetical protein I6I06_01220 [Paraburkholderia ginsengisoli]